MTLYVSGVGGVRLYSDLVSENGIGPVEVDDGVDLFGFGDKDCDKPIDMNDLLDEFSIDPPGSPYRNPFGSLYPNDDDDDDDIIVRKGKELKIVVAKVNDANKGFKYINGKVEEVKQDLKVVCDEREKVRKELEMYKQEIQKYHDDLIQVRANVNFTAQGLSKFIQTKCQIVLEINKFESSFEEKKKDYQQRVDNVTRVESELKARERSIDQVESSIVMFDQNFTNAIRNNDFSQLKSSLLNVRDSLVKHYTKNKKKRKRNESPEELIETEEGKTSTKRRKPFIPCDVV